MRASSLLPLQQLLLCTSLAAGTAGNVTAAARAVPNEVTVTVDWNTEKVLTHTAATVEVDVMPFLGRTDWGGPFNAYYEALANLGSEFVRYAPWVRRDNLLSA